LFPQWRFFPPPKSEQLRPRRLVQSAGTCFRAAFCRRPLPTILSAIFTQWSLAHKIVVQWM
jgi:hypothetical protein